jgi:glycosyltransferase involved in cell wall biosynthesis
LLEVSVILTTYNRPDALAAVLRGFRRQDSGGFELIIADDGSGEETARQVAQEARRAAFPVLHVWQEDRGFRAAAARNKALARARGEYVIFIDGDCIPRQDFVRAHRALAERGWFVSGNRVLLSRDFTHRVLTQELALECWSLARWTYWRIRGATNRLLPLVRLPGNLFRKWRRYAWQGVKTCNLGAWRRDLLGVNGLDERYVGWGHEDADLVVRLIRAGVHRKEGTFATAVLHLWHPQQDRHLLPRNVGRLAQAVAGQEIRAVLGVDQYL